MIPSTKQLAKWVKISDDGSEITLPSSAWLDVLWMLRVFERIEDIPSVQQAFAEAASDDRAIRPISPEESQRLT